MPRPEGGRGHREISGGPLEGDLEVVDRLAAEAKESGLSLNDYLLRTVLQHSRPNGGSASADDSGRETREAAGRSIKRDNAPLGSASPP